MSNLQFTQTVRGEGCTSGSQDDWRPPCNEDSNSPMFPIFSGRALIGQDRVTCSPTEPMRSHPHPTSWTDYGEGVVLRENEGAVTRRGSSDVAGKSSRASAPTFFKAAAVRAPPESPPLAWRLSLQSLRLSAGHASTSEAQPCLHLSAEPAASPSCPAVSSGFKLKSLVLLQTSMSQQVPSTIDSASPKPLPLPDPPFLQDPGQPPHAFQNYCLFS